ncbi:AMP-binding protein [Nonomuraea sp. NPDC049152]|uniref:AMP-binding protein n=1 Tax=Nonomuraea sp. NPDC049152 TaxID=3154350 RepID=UPI0033E9BFC9
MCGGTTRRSGVGDAPSGWAAYRDAHAAPASPAAHPGTAPEDPLLLYFTSGTTSRPKLVEHTQVSYPVGHLTTAYWIGRRPGDVHGLEHPATDGSFHDRRPVSTFR